MEVVTKGIPARLDDIPNGQCFAFEAGNQIVIGIKIAYPQSPNSRVLVLTSEAGQPPALLRQNGEPTIVYKQPEMAVVTGAAPGQLRHGVRNPRPGHVMQFEDDVFIGFIDERTDPSMASLKTGLINPNFLNGPTATFETWQIVIRGNDEPETVFHYRSAENS